MATERPIPAVGLRQQVPARYLRLLHEWARQIAEYQASIGNYPTSDKALWMRAVLNPDWEDGHCDGLTEAQATSWRVMWAECGRTDAHEGHDQPQDDLSPEQFEEIRSAIQRAVRDGDQP